MDANLLYSLTIFCFVRGANEQKETDRHEANKYGSSILYTFIIIIIMHVRSASSLCCSIRCTWTVLGSLCGRMTEWVCTCGRMSLSLLALPLALAPFNSFITEN